MTRISLWSALLSALGAAGTAAALLSYFGDFYFYSAMAFLLTAAGAVLLSLLPTKKHALLLGGLFLCFPAWALLAWESLGKSGAAALFSLADHLKEPYNLEVTLAPLPPGISDTHFLLFLTGFMAYLFLLGFGSLAGRLLASMLSLAMLLLGFYFGVNPPTISVLLITAYLITTLVSFKNRGPGHPEIMAFVSAVVLGTAVLLCLPESRYEQPKFFSSLQEKIVSFVDPYDPIFHAGNAYTGLMKGTDGRQHLGNTSGIHYTGRMIASIETEDSPHRIYLRSWVGGLYEKNQWKELPDSEYQPFASLFAKNQGEWYDQGAWLMEVLARNPAVAQHLLNYTKENELSQFKKEFSVNQIYDETSYFLLPYDADFGAPFFVYDRSPRGKDGKAYSTDIWQLPGGALLSMMGKESISDPYYLTYIGAEREYRNFVYAHYLTIPDSLKEALSSLGPISKVSTLTEKRQRIEEIHHFLTSQYRYSTHPGRTPQEADFISYFLTGNKSGYCTSFASAAVMLLRASGIPARYATGLTVGADEIQEAPVTKEGLHSLDINDHHAHAWAEVYVDGLGWRPCEMTPDVEGTENPFPIPPEKQKNESGAPNTPPDPKDKDGSSSEKPQTPPPSNPNQTQNPQQSQPSPQTPPQQKLTPQQPPKAGNGISSLLTFLLKILLLLLVLSLYPLYRLTAVSRLFAKATTSDEAFHQFLDYMMKLTTWAGLPMKGSYRSWKATLGNDPRFAHFPRIVDLLLKAKYAGQPLTKEEKQEILSIVKESRKQCLASLSWSQKIRFRLIEKL